MKSITFDNGMRWFLNHDDVVDQIENGDSARSVAMWLGRTVPFKDLTPGMALLAPLEVRMEVVRIVDVSVIDDSFEKAWKRMESKGYQYGADALEHVRLGWRLARGEIK